jgi:hypothetical protein
MLNSTASLKSVDGEYCKVPSQQTDIDLKRARDADAARGLRAQTVE